VPLFGDWGRRADAPSKCVRGAKGIKERIDQLRQDFSDIVTEEELSGYEAILTKTIEEAKEDPEA
jgi:hypothetical protein